MTAERPLTVEDIWAQFGTALQGFVGRHVAEREAAEDIVADVLLRVHQHLGAVDDHERVTVWLFRIARNAITDHYRRTGRRREMLDAAPEEKPGTPAPAADGWLDDQDLVYTEFAFVRQAPGRRAACRLPPRCSSSPTCRDSPKPKRRGSKASRCPG